MTRAIPMSPRFRLSALFSLLAAMLLVLTLAWHVPMMLWDHLDLVPIYAAWQSGALADSAFFAVHGGHMHTAAYAVLLATTALSHGQTWLDGVASWLLLLLHAGIIVLFIRETFADEAPRSIGVAALLVLLALHPGHLANLQWGWQVAVFLCLAGTSATLLALTRPGLTAWQQSLALVSATVACFSFATSIALLPTALVLIALRSDVSLRRRLLAALPWLIGAVAVAAQYRHLDMQATQPGIAAVAVYALNFLGAGIARFATDLAPWTAFSALIVAAIAFARGERQRTCLPWLGFALFASCASVLVALGRAAPFGGEHAFVTRYVSFSTLFWIGCIGIVASTRRERLPRALRLGFMVVTLFTVANAVHMAGKARQVSARTRAIAATIRSDWPSVDRALLGEVYFDQPDVARERLEALHSFGFAPFDETP